MSSIASNDSRTAHHSRRLAGWSRLPADYAIPERAPSQAEAQEYCRQLARSHYENFSVASWFLPGALAPAFLQSLCLLPDLGRFGR